MLRALSLTQQFVTLGSISGFVKGFLFLDEETGSLRVYLVDLRKDFDLSELSDYIIFKESELIVFKTLTSSSLREVLKKLFSLRPFSTDGLKNTALVSLAKSAEDHGLRNLIFRRGPEGLAMILYDLNKKPVNLFAFDHEFSQSLFHFPQCYNFVLGDKTKKEVYVTASPLILLKLLSTTNYSPKNILILHPHIGHLFFRDTKEALHLHDDFKFRIIVDKYDSASALFAIKGLTYFKVDFDGFPVTLNLSSDDTQGELTITSSHPFCKVSRIQFFSYIRQGVAGLFEAKDKDLQRSSIFLDSKILFSLQSIKDDCVEGERLVIRFPLNYYFVLPVLLQTVKFLGIDNPTILTASFGDNAVFDSGEEDVIDFLLT